MILNMNLYRPRIPIRGTLQRFLRFLQFIPMRDQRLQIYHLVVQQSDRRGPGMMVAINKLQINLNTYQPANGMFPWDMA